MELEITWSKAARVWWGFVWRSLISMVPAALLGGLIGAGLGYVLRSVDISSAVVSLVMMIVGGLLGLVVSIYAMKWLLRSEIGEFRLLLVSTKR